MSSDKFAPLMRIHATPSDYWEAPTLEEAPQDVAVDEDDLKRRRELAEELAEKDVWVGDRNEVNHASA